MHLVPAVALLALIVALSTGCGSESSSVVVPYVVGLQESLATQTADGAGLKPEIQYGANTDVPKGFVYSQSMREGSMAEEGETLAIWVSTGSP